MNIKRQMLSYGGVNMINASIPFLLLPLMTSYLTPSDYGIFALVQLLMTISLPLVMFNTQGLIKIDYTKFDFIELQSFISTIIWIPIYGTIFLEFLFYVFEDYIIQYFNIPSEYIFYIPAFVLAQAIPTIVLIIFQAKKEPLNYGKYKVSMTLMNLLFSLLLIVVIGYGWVGRLYGIVGSFVMFTFIGIIILYRLNLLKFKFNSTFLKEAFKFGIPYIPHTIAGVFLAMSNRLFLSNMIDNEAVGIYSVAFQVASVITIVVGSINQAWAPHLYEKLNNNPTLNQKKHIVKQTYKIMFLMSILTIVFIVISSFVYDLFIDHKYSEGKDLIFFLSLALLFQGFYFMVTNYILYSKKTYILSYITTFSIIIVFISNYFFIETYGLVGASYAMLVTWIFFFVLSWIVSNKIYSMPWRLK